MDAPDRDAFAVERAEVREGIALDYVREGAGGYPLLLVHGWPETKRIWWRNIRPLAEAGFEVIAPDLRGFGDSDLARDGFYDLAAHARDMHALITDVLGHERCAAAVGAAALIRGQRGAHARPVRTRGPRDLEAVPADVRSRLQRADRPVRRAGSGTLPAVGTCHPAEPHDRVLPPRPAVATEPQLREEAAMVSVGT